MKNKELFDKTIGILVNAYMNDVLDYFNCRACAVGNIVAANMGITLKKQGFHIVCDNLNYIGDWADVIRLGEGRVYGSESEFWEQKTTIEEIESTGYLATDLALIEEAFSIGTGHKCKDNYGGLMSVVDTLIKIHEGNEQETEAAKQLFVLSC